MPGHRFRELIGVHQVNVVLALQVVVHAQADGALDMEPLVGRKFIAVNDADRRFIQAFREPIGLGE